MDSKFRKILKVVTFFTIAMVLTLSEAQEVTSTPSEETSSQDYDSGLSFSIF